jgi:hypothetical protein
MVRWEICPCTSRYIKNMCEECKVKTAQKHKKPKGALKRLFCNKTVLKIVI